MLPAAVGCPPSDAIQSQSPELPCSWNPAPENKPQCAAYDTPAFETLYGGSAGGGKSDLILGLARKEHQRSLLLRRTFPDLERSLITRAFEFYGPSSAYNGSKHVWNIGARRIEFGHMENQGTASKEGDEAHYASAPYDFIAFDQLEQFSRYVYEFMFSRARTTLKGQRVRVLASANPTGEGVDWIIERWAPWLSQNHPHPAASGEVRYFKRDSEGREIETQADDPDAVSRTFIAARLSDNPYLDENYRRTLNLLPEPLRSQLLYGDWKAGQTDDAYQVIPRRWVELAMERWTVGKPDLKMSALGVDVARGGLDKTVYAPRYGSWFGELVKYRGIETKDGPIVAQHAQRLAQNEAVINFDVIGIGASAYDHANSVLGLNAIPVNFAEHSDGTDKSGRFKFANKRAECYWTFREALDPEHGEDIALPPDDELKADLCAPRYSVKASGIQIESKDDIKKRIGRSPDCGDAVVLAHSGSGSMVLFEA